MIMAPPDPVSAIAPIQTWYNGDLFRSRLEARWAVTLGALQIEYDYECEGYTLVDGTLYLPDFYLPQVRMHVEVKPSQSRETLELPAEAFRKAVLLATGTHQPTLILDGPPRDTNYWAVCPWRDEWEWCDVMLTDPNRYHLTEGRFFMDTGTRVRCHLPEQVPAHPAIIRGRTARFEHGAVA